jgi:hypothetical protein
MLLDENGLLKLQPSGLKVVLERSWRFFPDDLPSYAETRYTRPRQQVSSSGLEDDRLYCLELMVSNLTRRSFRLRD